MERKKRKWLSYVLSAAILTANALSGGVSASAATLVQDNQVVKMDLDEEGRMVYTLQGNMDKGLNLSLEPGETVVVDGNGYTINGEEGVAASYYGGEKSASAALSVKGEGTVLLKDITLVGGAGNNASMYNGEAANGVCVTDNASVICQGNVAIMAGKSAADPQASGSCGDDGCEGMRFEGDKLLVDKGAHLEIKGGDGGEGRVFQSNGGNGLYFAGNALQVEQTASVSITGGSGSVGKSSGYTRLPEKGGKGGNALQLMKGCVDASLTEQKASVAGNGVITLTPGLGGESSDPATVSGGAIGAPLDYISGYVSDRDMIDESGTQSKKLTITYCLGEESYNYKDKILEQKDLYTKNTTIDNVDELAVMPGKLSKIQTRKVCKDSSGEVGGIMAPGTAIQDNMRIYVVCCCEHNSGVQLKAGSEDSYLCNMCGVEMEASFTDQKGNVRYSSMDNCITEDLLQKAAVGESIRLLRGKDSCGENLTWSVLKLTDDLKFRLVVEGTGVFGKNITRSWELGGNQSVDGSIYITEIEIKSGVTGIAENAFSQDENYARLTKIQIANGTTISDKAFQNSAAQLSEVEVTANEQAATNLTKEDLIKGGFPEDITYQFPVTFVGNNKEAASSVTCVYGNTVSPAAISYSGHTLLGWYQTPTFKEGTEWNFDTDKVQGAVMLYAKWKSNSSSGGGSGVVRPVATPSASPSAAPSETPSATPTVSPSAEPTVKPSVEPSVAPSETPTATPSVKPSVKPSAKPTVAPSSKPTAKPSNTPKPAAKGKKITDKKTGAVYKVTKSKGKKPTVSYVSAKKNKKKKITIPKQVTINGVTYQVTAIQANTFKGDKKLTEVILESNIKTIGKNAFRNCKKLKKITIRSKKLTNQSVGKDAWKGISKDAVVQVPKGMKKKYEKLLRKKGLPKTASVKKSR